MALIKPFKDLNKKDVAIAGGKGASLGEMTQARISVPGGFVILSNAFDRFLKETDLNVEIDSILHKVDHKKIHTVEKASEKIKSLILSVNVPKDIANEIKRSSKKLNTKYIAVRSSATVEDSASAAWAGQLESYLNTTEANLLENVKKCWASLSTPRAIFYRFEKELHKQKISVAVVIQKMIQSESSGIAFSVHPVTQDRNQLIIEAGLGLGEAVVSGQITPDSYVVEKKPRRIIDKNIQKQSKGLFCSNKEGNEWRDVSKIQGEKQVLTDKQILELSNIILKIEEHYGFPCDIEWAKEKSKFYIIQSRPITTLKNIVQNKQSIFHYIKSQNWFFGVRADESLLCYSAKRDEYVRIIKKDYGIEFAETLLVPLKKNYLVRVFNLRQAKAFHAISKEKVFKNPKILFSYVKKNDMLWKNIVLQEEELTKAIKKKDYFKSLELFKKIFNLYEIASAQFIIIFSLGLKLTEDRDKLKNIRKILKTHDVWRNNVAFKNEELEESLFYFFKFLTNQKNLKLNPLLLIRFLTLNEVEMWLDEKLSDKEIVNIVSLRKKQGFIYLNLRVKSQEAIDDLKEIKNVQGYFLKLDKLSKKTQHGKDIIGQVAYGVNKKIKGRVVVIKNKTELKNKKRLLKDKILVATQTTPHYIPYLKEVKAIITDEGGLTCHAAIVAREFKKPCIVGTKTATETLKTDDVVEVNTDKGIIKVIKK